MNLNGMSRVKVKTQDYPKPSEIHNHKQTDRDKTRKDMKSEQWKQNLKNKAYI